MPTLFEAIEPTVLRGVITRVVWKGEGRAIVELRQTGGAKVGTNGQKLSAVGDLLEPAVGQELEFSGELAWNDKYHQHQLKIATYRTILPTDTDGIARYLIDVAKWVGPHIADQLVKTFGPDTLDVLKNHPERIQIKGLTADHIAEMQATLQANAKLEAAAIEVHQLLAGAVGPAATRRAIKKWGLHAARLIRRDPYRLTTLPGVGFITADAVARKIGFPLDARRRHAHAVRHVLSEAAGREGHTRISLDRLRADAAALLGNLRPDALAYCRRAHLTEAAGTTVAARELLDAERYIAGKLTAMLAADRGADRCPTISRDGLAPDQVAAVAVIERNPVAILTGAPGTGKTYTTARVIQSFQSAGLRLALCAPTGKAAKQISLAMADLGGCTASTIHRLLGPTLDEETGEFTFEHGEGNPLPVDVLIADEVSMIDARLMASLLRATPGTARILFVGDHYQLPSVGPGAVLRDLLAAGVPAYELRDIKRNAGRIVHACHAIKDGRVPAPSAKLDEAAGENWRHIDASKPAEIKAVIETLLAEKLPALGLDALWDVQLISPVNEKGELSCDALNALARGLLNPAGERIEKLAFGPGDKVVRCKNGTAILAPGPLAAEEEEASDEGDTPSNPREVAIVNGDIGIVQGVTGKQIDVAFRFPARRVYLPRIEHHLKMAYCLTCHKMQGSEVSVVILPLHRSYARLPMYNREWLYTAISRAKRFIVTAGDLSTLPSGIARVGTHLRQTSLRELTVLAAL